MNPIPTQYAELPAMQTPMIERGICYVLEKIFNGIMLLLYGQHPSETKAQKLTRLGLVLVTTVSIIIFLLVIKKLFAPGGAELKVSPVPIKIPQLK